ncbi:MAG: Response Regulator Receiver Signal Transduction Histidine Kinase [Candidatus Curtissbacteria bacterium GW2011_GWA1_40_24]|uniref:Response Regulator Receiver Signal Transduction Histidine Kinase n=2 Tax=Patescibacteria group TaxID=1783273 RepID=A0A0G0S0C2_9BACT|nr:MAG: Response Regulator Receiver Signal Transduction Histidine Kinase [Candidatus Curtissbacteria bacterium GW2011_GWA1_40_24]KKR89011.1 MAG: Response Regulator Receiver Signal Transduction Histidine Kinase [Candidatus Wolfebacteria bacterium GW2011_GWB1_41_12]
MIFGAPKKSKIVIIDDEPSFLSIFSTALGKENFEVKTFSDPQEALKNIVGEKPDVILLDIKMPGLDGFQVFEYLKKDFGKNLPKVLFLTSLGETISGTAIDNHFAKTIGANGYIHKTDDLNNIVKKVKETIENQ